MASTKPKTSSIDKYISQFPKEIQRVLEKLRQTIKKSAPKSEETMSYGIPTFDMNGKHLVHFAAFKKHIGFYPTPSGISKFQKEMSDYETAKGSVKFPLDKPIPFDLVKEIVKFRVEENKSK